MPFVCFPKWNFHCQLCGLGPMSKYQKSSDGKRLCDDCFLRKEPSKQSCESAGQPCESAGQSCESAGQFCESAGQS